MANLNTAHNYRNACIFEPQKFFWKSESTKITSWKTPVGGSIFFCPQYFWFKIEFLFIYGSTFDLWQNLKKVCCQKQFKIYLQTKKNLLKFFPCSIFLLKSIAKRKLTRFRTKVLKNDRKIKKYFIFYERKKYI